MKTTATVMQVSRSLLILTPAEYDKPESTIQISAKRNNVPTPTVFGAPQIFELNDSLKDHPMQKADELARFVKRCAESIGLNLGDVFFCIEDEDNVVSTEYTHPVAKEKMLSTYAHVEAEKILHGDISQYTIIHSEYGYQFGSRAKKTEDLQAALFAMSSKTIADIKIEFEKEGLHVVKIIPPITALIHAGKRFINSSAKTVALISIDYVATRLVILHNGAPIFQQSFSSVLEDVAEMLSLEFGISPLGAIDMIRENGLGVCDRCNDANTRKQTMGMLDNAAGEILRTIRMVISTQKVDVDQIVICDSLCKLANLSNYCRSIGLTAPIENISSVYTQGVAAPVATETATDKGYNSSCYVTFNTILSMGVGEGNFLGGESGVMSTLKKTSTLGGKITMGVGAVVLVWMIVVSGWWIFLETQHTNDQNALNDPILTEAKELLKEQEEYQQKLDNLEGDKDLLPQTVVGTNEIVEQLFDLSDDNLGTYQSISISNSSNSITADVITSDFNQYVDFRDAITELKSGFFDLSSSMTSTMDNDGKVMNTLSLSLSAEAISKAQEEKEAAAAEEDGTASTETDAEASTNTTTEEASE